MATQKIKFDAGEKRHVRTNVKIISGEDLPFQIRVATWELWDEDENLEDQGDCYIDEHMLDAYISPQKTGTYTLKYIYEVADEIWVDPVRVVVS